MITGHNIVCFAPSDWWGMNPSCTTHIMRALAAENKVLYINPFSSDLLGGVSKKGLGRRILRKLKSVCKWLRHPLKNLYVFSPIFLPFQGKPFLDAVNNALLKLQIKLVCKMLHMSKPILWVENLRAADMLDWLDPELTLYHVSDLFADCTYTRNRAILQQREKKIREKSDALICVSRQLHDAMLGEVDRAFYLPHGVDFELFRQAAETPGVLLPQLADIPHPIAGYFGTLTALNDIELMDYCVAQLPNVSFVLAGQVTGGDYEAISKRPNVHMIGRVPYEQIPALCSAFDVCLLNWKMSDWIRHCNPLKFFEYMASGRPIVSVPIVEIAENYADVVSVAETKEAFCEAIERELSQDNPARAKDRIEIARQHSWTLHTEKLSAIIEQGLAGWVDEKAELQAVKGS